VGRFFQKIAKSSVPWECTFQKVCLNKKHEIYK
jgi:hypothetical protein